MGKKGEKFGAAKLERKGAEWKNRLKVEI